MARSFTVADLVQRLDLTADLVGPSTAAIGEVRIVDDPEAVRRLDPGTVVVLTGEAGREPWSVDMAVRYAWERAAACVIVTREDAHSDATRALAERLPLALLSVDAPPLDTAVRVATIVAADEASAAGTLSAAARAFGVGALAPERALAVLRRVLPALDFALVDAHGDTIAGTGQGEPLIEIAVPFPRRAGSARLRAFAENSERAGAVVEPALRLAIAPLTAWAALRRLDDERAARASVAALGQILDAPASSAAEGRPLRAALGWPLDAPMRLVALLPTTGADPHDFGSAAVYAAEGHPAVAGCAPFEDAWILLIPARRTTGESRLSAIVEEVRSSDARLSGASAGISGLVASGTPLRAAVLTALAAARIARSGATGLLFGERIGPAAALPALLPAGSADAARVALAPLLEVDRDGSLLLTLATALDHADRPAVVASVLGVHRNTVAARLERVRLLGIDTADPQQRLAIHIAARRLLEGRQDATAP